MSESTKPPKGVVMVLLDRDGGRPIANAACFEPGKAAGFTLRQMQEIRCKKALARAVLDALASPRLVAAIEPYDGERILERLASTTCQIAAMYVEHEGE